MRAGRNEKEGAEFMRLEGRCTNSAPDRVLERAWKLQGRDNSLGFNLLWGFFSNARPLLGFHVVSGARGGGGSERA